MKGDRYLLHLELVVLCEGQDLRDGDLELCHLLSCKFSHYCIWD